MFNLATVIVCALFAGPLWAQAPATPASSARADDPAYSVFRWIKIQGDTQRKPAADAAKPKPKTEPAPVRRPEAQVAAPVTRSVRPQATSDVAPSPAPAPAPDIAPAETTQQTAPLNPTPVASSPVAPVTAAAASAPVEVEPEAAEEPEPELKVISQEQPVFPRGLGSITSFGKVIVSFTVQTDGTVADATVVSYSNHKLRKPATDAVSKWVFEPVKKPRTVQVEIAFNAQQ
ncbi:MAG: TonB family protein [Rhodoferax sp.]